MEAKNALQVNYDQNANAYSQFITTPLGTLEQQLFDLAIKDLDGLKVLDLGGGTGLRARDALKAGARCVDVVDISPEMMRMGQEHEKSIGRDRITWYQADVSKPLDHLSLGPYDMVVANGIFDHAHSTEELEGMLRNATAYLAPGGRVVANWNNPMSKSAVDGKYGVFFTDFMKFPEGIKFHYNMKTDPPLVFDSIGLYSYHTEPRGLPAKFFKDLEIVPFESTPVVAADPEFWKTYLADPILYIFSAKKADDQS